MQSKSNSFDSRLTIQYIPPMKAFMVAGIGIAVFIEFLLVSKKNKSAPDLILTAWMFLILLHLFMFYLYISEEIRNLPFLLGIEQPLPLLHGVFLYFYVATLSNQLPRHRGLLVLNLIPACAMYAYLIPFFILPPDQKIQVYQNHGAGFETYMFIKWYAVAGSGVFYVVWSGLLLKRHRDNIREQFSDLHRIKLQWLRILTIGLGVIWIFVIFFRSELLVMGGVVVFVFLIGVFGVRQAAIFTQVPATDEAAEQRKKYPKSGLTEEAARTLHQSLLQLMAEEGLYKKSDLSINDLASRLNVHPNYLSQIINQTEKKNFYDFINTYRIEEFKRLIAKPESQQFTLLSIAYDCGFSSKSSFNRYFKKTTGQTPSEYFSALTARQDRPS